MTDQNSILTMIRICVGLFLLWGLSYYCLRLCRIDAFRQELFVIRDEMFLYAADGAVSFQDPAYTGLRSAMNSMIRFAHRVTFTRLLFTVLLDDKSTEDHAFEEWRAAMRKLPVDVQSCLEQYHYRMHIAVLRHMTTGSPVLLTGVALFALIQLVRGTLLGVRRLLEAFAAAVPGVEPGIEQIELQAVRARYEDLSRRTLSPAF